MNAPNTLSADETAAGFRLLFDGRTTAGWRGYRQEEIYPHWRVVDDALMFHPEPNPQYGHDIISVDQFRNFEFRIEWRLQEGGNSGIMYHVRETDDRPYMTGPEYQLLDNDRHGDARNGLDRHTGACYALYAPTEPASAPIGTWNRTTIIVDGGDVQHVLNDRTVCTYTLGSADWQQRITGTKFADWQGFAAERNGHICLQDHLDPVAFRNIRIRTW
ncbi:MAG TPA: DUF1080 domain-containing protein [Tepidisphaeraceae bacterium]|jgi:hypothetical protein|nr:DUF1080 domain-containing protein [Tepidisphaeraceae bacterium]